MNPFSWILITIGIISLAVLFAWAVKASLNLGKWKD